MPGKLALSGPEISIHSSTPDFDMTRAILSVTGPCLLLLVLSGCGGSATKHAVSGSVDIDGTPVSDGMVAFVPKEQSTTVTRAEAIIQNGKYKLPIVSGSYTVQITAQKKVPLEPGESSGTPGEKDKIVSIMPEHYNGGVPLTAEIKGPGTFDFHVKTTQQ
jgi:hypothetical protein